MWEAWFPGLPGSLLPCHSHISVRAALRMFQNTFNSGLVSEWIFLVENSNVLLFMCRCTAMEETKEMRIRENTLTLVKVDK